MAEIAGKTSKPPTAATAVPASQPAGGSSGGSGPAGKWWVIGTQGESRVTPYQAIESAKKPAGSVAGPFATKAEADSWIAKQEGKFPISIPNPLSGIGAVGHWIGLAVEHLSDGAMWRSLGWLALGAFLVIAGIYLWFRTSSTYKGIESAVVGTAKAL